MEIRCGKKIPCLSSIMSMVEIKKTEMRKYAEKLYEPSRIRWGKFGKIL